MQNDEYKNPGNKLIVAVQIKSLEIAIFTRISFLNLEPNISRMDRTVNEIFLCPCLLNKDK